MERAISQNERIRRAQEIYARRQNLRERTKRATVSVSKPKNFKLLKKLILQIIICSLIYYIFYLINTTNYSFSKSALDKTEELISYDVDFMSICNSGITAINEYISPLNVMITDSKAKEENKVEEFTEYEKENEVDEHKEESINDKVSVNDIEETTTQTDKKEVELSETDRIKEKYSFILPTTGYVTSEFGEREATSSIISGYHKGIDIGATTGTRIIASTSGTVSISRYSPSYGNYIMIENDEVKTVYAHCSKLLAKVRGYDKSRTRNSKGAEKLGNTTGPHLHFEIRINDVCVDPRKILEF